MTTPCPYCGRNPTPATIDLHAAKRCPRPDRSKANSYRRGYGPTHQKLRKFWSLQVASGTVACARCGDLIARGQRWDLGHDDDDRSKYVGPEHATCNRRAGGQRNRDVLGR